MQENIKAIREVERRVGGRQEERHGRMRVGKIKIKIKMRRGEGEKERIEKQRTQYDT